MTFTLPLATEQEQFNDNSTMAPVGLLGVSLVTEKLITLFAMATITFLFGMLPLALFAQLRNNTDPSSKIRWRQVISFSSCFAGGVFFAACFLDLLKDVEENFARVLNEIKEQYKVDLDYPVAQFVVAMGFFLILIIEQTVLHFQEEWAHEEERAPLLSQGPSTPRREGGSYGAVTPRREAAPHSTPGHNHGHRNGDTEAVTGVSNEVHHTNDGHSQHSHVEHGAFQHSSLRSMMLLLALSFHSVFEGLAIGLQDDSSHMISVFLAVIIHKAVMSFSLGLNIAQSNLSKKSFVWSNVCFSLSSPIGVGIGIGLSDLPSSLPQDILNGVLQGIAGGTFLYITFFEVLPHELNTPGKRLWKVFCVILGFAVICGILFITH